MSRIDDENKKQFRKPMKILAGINGRDTRVAMTATPSGSGLAVYDTITTEYPHRMVADFSGGGVPLNGSRKTVPKSGEPVSDSTGKTGLQTHVGAGQSVTINWALNKQIEIASITLVFDPESSGTITASTMGYTMPIAPRVVIPAGAKSGTVTITNDSESKRVILYDMAPGISLDFTEADIVKASLALRADLSVDTQAIPTSEIELQVYWTQDISASISNISDNASIYYQSGYPGDMSETRHFYLSEPATMADGLITIKGEDASRHLDEKKISAQDGERIPEGVEPAGEYYPGRNRRCCIIQRRRPDRKEYRNRIQHPYSGNRCQDTGGGFDPRGNGSGGILAGVRGCGNPAPDMAAAGGKMGHLRRGLRGGNTERGQEPCGHQVREQRVPAGVRGRKVQHMDQAGRKKNGRSREALQY